MPNYLFRTLHILLKSHVHHVQYVDCTQVQYVDRTHVQYIDCTQVQYVDYKCALDVLMVKDAWNVNRLVPREPLTQLV